MGVIQPGVFSSMLGANRLDDFLGELDSEVEPLSVQLLDPIILVLFCKNVGGNTKRVRDRGFLGMSIFTRPPLRTNESFGPPCQVNLCVAITTIEALLGVGATRHS